MRADMAEESRFPVEGAGEVSALLVRPAGARWLYVLAHGAGAGMRHAFMEAMAGALAAADVATFRYQFPYMEAGGRRPDGAPRLEATVRAAVRAAAEAAPGLPLVAGGKSMGGRMTSRAAAAEALPGVRGLVFLGFPLHPAGKPGTERGDHLADVSVPMLFLQGTRDKLAQPDLVRPLCTKLPRATLHEVEGADHGFHVLKRSGRTDDDVRAELAATVREWLESLARGKD
jgi:predicted alpha/beta-hydrolase family hydrolase